MIRIAYAGDRDISVWVLRFILEQGVKPLALMISDQKRASHAKELLELCSYLDKNRILIGKTFRSKYGVDLLRSLNLDYIIAVHFPYYFPKEVLEIPRIGVLNLHPAYLPYNRGWHTVSWAILEDTPIGATLHFMDEGIDTGYIVYQKQVSIRPNDTAHTLYQRVKQVELEVFREAWPLICSKYPPRKPQDLNRGTMHLRKDLFSPEIQRLNLDQIVKIGELLKKLRALTTNNLNEAAYFEVDGKRYRVQISIFEEEHKENKE